MNSFNFYQILQKQNPKHYILLKILPTHTHPPYPISDLKFPLVATVSCLNILWIIKHLKTWSWESQPLKHRQFLQLFSQGEPVSFPCLQNRALSCFIVTKLL